MKVELVSYSETFLELSWNWLNDPEIKKLTNTPSFSKEDQKKFFESIHTRHDYKIWGIEYEGIPVGVCGLKKITTIDCEYWGYIGCKEYWSKGIGTEVLFKLIGIARDRNLESIWLTVLNDNSRAIGLYSKIGFKQEGNTVDNLITMRLVL